MGRPRSFKIIFYNQWAKGKVEHNKKDLIAAVDGIVDASGGVYIRKEFVGKKTRTYVFDSNVETDLNSSDIDQSSEMQLPWKELKNNV